MNLNTLTLSAASILLAASLNATVSLNVFSAGWGDENGPANGMAWGVVTSATDDFTGFASLMETQLLGFEVPTPEPGPPSGFQIGTTSYFYHSAQSATAFGPGGDGFMDGVASLTYNFISGEAGDSYGILWFGDGDGTVQANDYFGFQLASGVLPPDSQTINIPGLTPSNATFQVVPEPATYAMLAGFAALAFVAIRRRK